MWNDLSMKERAALIKLGVESGVYDINEIRNTYNSYAEGGSLNPYSAGSLVDTIHRNSKKEEYLGEPSHHYDFTISEEEADRLGYYPNERGHRDDRVKKPSHPTHPSRGKWNSSEEFELTDKGMNDPNYTLFGLNDGGQDPQAVMTYKGGIVLPEITVTSDGKKYIYNSYDNVNIYAKGGYKPSYSIKKRISDWEGSSMKTNRGFEDEARSFNMVLPQDAISRLTQEQLDGLYSYSYNVGSGTFKKRVAPVLANYIAGRATAQDVQSAMWASKDKKLRGLAKRRNAERAMFGSYNPTYDVPRIDIPALDVNPIFTENVVEPPQLELDNVPNLEIPITDDTVPSSTEETDYNSFNPFNNILSILGTMESPRKINIHI